MHIIRAVTVRTAIAGLFHRRKRTTVAVVAGYVDVGAMQLEVCLNIVIEQPQVPRDRVVTRLAVVFERAIVCVVFKMAADTLTIGVGEYLTLVASIAFTIAVCA